MYNTMTNVYLFSGLGADQRAFQNLVLPDFHKVPVRWIDPVAGETINAYATRIRQQIVVADPVLIGVSFGGMVAVEIAKQLPSARLILISSAGTAAELAALHTFFFRWKLYRMIPGFLLKRSNFFLDYLFGVRSEEDKKILADILADTDVHFFRWALGAIARWENESLPQRYIHIHGTADKIIPYKNVQPDYAIEEGGHLMILNRAAEISRIINDFLLQREQ